MQQYDVVIVGGGISGLHTAYELAKQKSSFLLLESRERFGGRIYSPNGELPELVEQGFDLGPSWFWPGQVNIESLVVELGLENKVFSQYFQGDSIYEASNNDPIRGLAGISMQGSYRMQGGLSTIIRTLVSRIRKLAGKQSILKRSEVEYIRFNQQSVFEVSVKNGQCYLAKKVILALPPRVALQQIQFVPRLAASRVEELNQVATWMAGHAKMVAIYKTAFWREAGLTGDVISQRGPLSEIHDATPASDDVFALFGFFATPPQSRKTNKSELDQMIIEQLVRLFGDVAASPLQILYKDWARDAFTATEFDQLIPDHHPSNVWSEKTESAFNHQLIWSGTESADGHYNGYIEGAIMASHNALAQL